jgi:hypothetical protein
MPNLDAASAARDFGRDGYVVLRDFWPAEGLGALTRVADRVLAQWQETQGAAWRSAGLVNMHALTHPQYFNTQPEARVAFFHALLPPALTGLLDAVFGGGLYFHNTQLFFNPADPAQPPYWHRDLQYSAIHDAAQAREQGRLLSLHVRIPLLAETGLALVPGSHRRWDSEREHRVRFEKHGHRRDAPLPGETLLTLASGDVLVFDAQMLHRGHYAGNAARRALDLCVGKAHPFTTSFLDPAVLPVAGELAQLDNGEWYREAWRVLQPGHSTG